MSQSPDAVAQQKQHLYKLLYVMDSKLKLTPLPTLITIMQNILSYPGEMKYRSIKRDNAKLAALVAQVPFAMDLMLLAGFKEETLTTSAALSHTILHLHKDANLHIVQDVLFMIKNATSGITMHNAMVPQSLEKQYMLYDLITEFLVNTIVGWESGFYKAIKMKTYDSSKQKEADELLGSKHVLNQIMHSAVSYFNELYYSIMNRLDDYVNEQFDPMFELCNSYAPFCLLLQILDQVQQFYGLKQHADKEQQDIDEQVRKVLEAANIAPQPTTAGTPSPAATVYFNRKTATKDSWEIYVTQVEAAVRQFRVQNRTKVVVSALKGCSIDCPNKYEYDALVYVESKRPPFEIK